MAKTFEEALEDLRASLKDPEKTGGVIRIPRILWGNGVELSRLAGGNPPMITIDPSKVSVEEITRSSHGHLLGSFPEPKEKDPLMIQVVDLLTEIQYAAGAGKITCPSCREIKHHWTQCRLKSVLDKAKERIGKS